MKGSKAVFAASLLFTLTSCADRSPPQSAPSAPAAVLLSSPPIPARIEPLSPLDNPVVIVTIDGVRWQEIFEGTEPSRSGARRIPARKLLPNLYSLGTESGAFVGAPGFGVIAASGPEYVSLPGYTEIFGGRSAHACRNNDCARTTVPTLLDDALASGSTLGAFSSWSKIDFALSSSAGAFDTSCGPGGDASVRDAKDPNNSREDDATVTAALASYEATRPDIFYLGLGETDEHAHFGNYAGYIGSLKYADDVLGRLRTILARDERGKRTHIFVTADHGRAADFRTHGGASPESARVWLVASGPRIAARGFVHSPETRHLADIAPTIRRLLGLDTKAKDVTGEGQVMAELFTSST